MRKIEHMTDVLAELKAYKIGAEIRDDGEIKIEGQPSMNLGEAIEYLKYDIAPYKIKERWGTEGRR